jgi:mono/diheme cytochrome c family protein
VRIERALILAIVATGGAPRTLRAAPTEDRAALERQLASTVRPFVASYCVGCHGAEKPKGDLDLTKYGSLDAVVADHPRWAEVLDRVATSDMPPEKAKRHPSADERQAVVRFIEAMRRYEGQRHAGDPGVVLARRLSNAEYDYSVADLTGVDIRPTREFPVDPANAAGFDNSGESLGMSPALLKKYLEAARRVSDFLVLTPHGLEFAPHPVVADTDRDRYSVNRIIAFYSRLETDQARYFEAAWRYQHRAALGQPRATLAGLAAEAKLSPRYLATIWKTLTMAQTVGPVAKLQAMWRKLPGDPAAAKAGCEAMRDFVVGLRKKLVPEVANLEGGKVNKGSQPLLMWKNRRWAENRRRCDQSVLTPDAKDPELVVPGDAKPRARALAAFDAFCATFPDAFFISERGRTYADQESEKAKGRGGRLLSAGFHSMTGYFRDDRPLYDLMLDEGQRRELDRLWDDFFFMSSLAVRMHTSFLWFERSDSSFMMGPEFGFTRPEDKSCTDEPVLKRLAQVYEEKARSNGASETVLQAIRDHFEHTNQTVRWLEKARIDAVPRHLADLQDFARRAFRRPLRPGEGDELVRFYRSLREQNGLEHEEAIRNTLVRVLMSPHFLYRADPVDPIASVRPLSDQALASRLSYFLWASVPDQPLLDLAARGTLHRPEVLAAQTRRMLKDPRARRLATEFVGNWLDFRRFEQHNGVDRERYPTFDNELREAMFEEPIRFALDVIQRDRPVLDFLYGQHTFVNAPLAKHYGMPAVEGDQWVRVDRADRYGRGGLLPMAVFLTANSPGLRTSPVKRGYWVVRRLLGEHIPPPPANVPELPHDEAKLGELTLRQVMERHRADKACAGCHARFDAFGLVFEGYGPVGDRRERDFGGRPVDTQALFPDGSTASGLDGLVRYVRERRQGDFVDNLCRKLFAYGLGRSLILSDEATVEQMKRRLASGGQRFGALVETIVQSPQFLTKRGAAAIAQE